VSNRRRALTVLALILALAVAVPALVAYTLAARAVQADQRISQLERRVEQVETDVSLLRE
jgi:hypothetical protein